jgi:hypothetical protein
MLNKMSYLKNVHAATHGYVNSTNTAKWANANPDAFELYAYARQLEATTHGE